MSADHSILGLTFIGRALLCGLLLDDGTTVFLFAWSNSFRIFLSGQVFNRDLG